VKIISGAKIISGIKELLASPRAMGDSNARPLVPEDK
jgi:hypothetical protein